MRPRSLQERKFANATGPQDAARLLMRAALPASSRFNLTNNNKEINPLPPRGTNAYAVQLASHDCFLFCRHSKSKWYRGALLRMSDEPVYRLLVEDIDRRNSSMSESFCWQHVNHPSPAQRASKPNLLRAIYKRPPDHMPESGPSSTQESFIVRWARSSASKRANYQLFLSELCDFLDLPRPQPGQARRKTTRTPTYSTGCVTEWISGAYFCDADTPESTVQFIQYLQEHGIGLEVGVWDWTSGGFDSARWDFPSPKISSFTGLSCHQKGYGLGKVVESWYSTGIPPTTPK